MGTKIHLVVTLQNKLAAVVNERRYQDFIAYEYMRD